MNDKATHNVADYVQKLGIGISALSRATGVPDGVLRRSLTSRERPLRAMEFLRICDVLSVDPRNFHQGTS